MRLETLLAHPAVQALGRALLHFLWQGTLLALLLWMVKAIAPTSARVRYAAASLIMLLMPVALVVTVARDLWRPQPVASIAPMVSSHTQAPGETSREALIAALPTSAPDAGISGWAVCFWVAGVFLLSLRAAGGWMRAQRLKRRVLAASAELQDMMTRLKQRLGISAPVRFYTSAIVQVPTVIGWIRPYVLLPVTTITGLSESQLEAILAHELAHIRRHDYLVNLLQTAVETVLFYHPAVWWVGKQMRIEREHCCDDIAVAVCGDAVEYASALAELEQLRSVVPEPALAATGGELLGRIRRLVNHQPSEDRASRSLGTIAAAALVLLIAIAPSMHSLNAAPPLPEVRLLPQPPVLLTPAPTPAQASPAASTRSPKNEFDVTSVKPYPAGGQPGPSEVGCSPTGKFAAVRSPVLYSIRWAYNAGPYQNLNVVQQYAVGFPAWVASRQEAYDIEGRTETRVTEAQCRLMVQALLADRFKLSVHRETRALPVAALVVAKGGPKPKLKKVLDSDLDKTVLVNGTPAYGSGNGWSMDQLAEYLLRFSPERMVVDRTGLEGQYRFSLEFAVIPPAGGAPLNVADEVAAALQDQLGLKIENRSESVEVVVVDHIEKPDGN
jgi:uncharacterized protein (TIGR03435 family)